MSSNKPRVKKGKKSSKAKVEPVRFNRTMLGLMAYSRQLYFINRELRPQADKWGHIEARILSGAPIILEED